MNSDQTKGTKSNSDIETSENTNVMVSYSTGNEENNVQSFSEGSKFIEINCTLTSSLPISLMSHRANDNI